MKILPLSSIIPLAVTAALALPVMAQDAQRIPAPDFATLEAAQNAANAKPGPRTVPGRSIPVPNTASPQLQTLIAAPYGIPSWSANPKSADEWKALVRANAAATATLLQETREKLGVTLEPTVIGGVKAFIVTPKDIPPANRNRLLVHVHGGAYVYDPGEAGTDEATLMAGYGGFKVVSIDYRMPPDHPYPAAMDDAMAAWKGGAHACGAAQHGDLRQLDRRRHDLGDDPARQAGGPAVAGGDRARHAMVGPDGDRRYLQD